MASTVHLLQRMLDKFEHRAPLDDLDRAALLSLPFEQRRVAPGRYIVREGDRSPGSTLIIQGLAIRHKVTVDGARQILSVHIPADFVDLQGTLLTVLDHNVQALTECELAIFPREAMVRLIDTHPRVARALWIDTLIDGSIFREWIVNVGRRDARSGMAHLLCEFARRLEVAGLGKADGYELPMTQEQLADALGLTPVHVNRVLKDLDREGLIKREKRYVQIQDWHRLKKVGGFSELYLHLDQAVTIVGDRAALQRAS